MRMPLASRSARCSNETAANRTTAAANLVAGIDSGDPRVQLHCSLKRRSKGYALVPSAPKPAACSAFPRDAAALVCLPAFNSGVLTWERH